VIAFPKTAKGTCMMTDSPSAVTARQLRDLYIDVKVKKPETGITAPPSPAS
jgi:aspartyl-tRNA synthetase